VELNESCQHYLTNYYLLEQTRNETNLFLEEIAQRFADLVEEHLKLKGNDLIDVGSWVQKGGGEVDFTMTIREGVSNLEQLGDGKYTIVYRDAMRTTRLSDTTKCRIYGTTPKANSATIRELTRKARSLDLPDPYREVLVDLLGSPVDDVVDEIARVFVNYFDDYARIVQALADEQKD
jgi:hypothetical protein